MFFVSFLNQRRKHRFKILALVQKCFNTLIFLIFFFGASRFAERLDQKVGVRWNDQFSELLKYLNVTINKKSKNAPLTQVIQFKNEFDKIIKIKILG